MTDRGGGGTVLPLTVQVVLGPCDDMRAEVFVRAAAPDGDGAVQLAGTLSGPECRRSITLPVAAPLTDLGGSGSGLLAKAVLTEPAFWTPELPNLYRLDVRATTGGETLAEHSRRIGLRRSGIRGRSLWLEGRRWVPRGVGCEPAACDIESLRAAGAAAVVADPPESLLTDADTSGLAVVAAVQSTDGQPIAIDDAVHHIATWAAHASAVMTIIGDAIDDETAVALAARVQRLKGTMLLGRVVDGAAPPPLRHTDGIDCLVLALDADVLPHEGWRDAAPPLPLVSWRRDVLPVQERRRGCDQLQAALAVWGLADGRSHQPWDWAGYLVS